MNKKSVLNLFALLCFSVAVSACAHKSCGSDSMSSGGCKECGDKAAKKACPDCADPAKKSAGCEECKDKK